MCLQYQKIPKGEKEENTFVSKCFWPPCQTFLNILKMHFIKFKSYLCLCYSSCLFALLLNTRMILRCIVLFQGKKRPRHWNWRWEIQTVSPLHMPYLNIGTVVLLHGFRQGSFPVQPRDARGSTLSFCMSNMCCHWAMASISQIVNNLPLINALRN